MTPEQQDLLQGLMEAWLALPVGQRSPFMVLESRSPSHYYLTLPRGSKFHHNAYVGDVDTLIELGYLRPKRGKHGLSSLDPTNEGRNAYAALKQHEPGVTARAESFTKRYLDSTRMQERYPDTWRKLSDADRLLWSSDIPASLTAIGHHCREALQSFATVLVSVFAPAGVDVNPQKTINRIRAVLESQRSVLGDTSGALLDALCLYWEALNGIVQRQEHGSLREGHPLSWEDGRQVVFHTGMVFLEIDRALQRVRPGF